jgi:late competence protein required for DNA uptake (superfamily II DNA/RNA helicase)
MRFDAQPPTGKVDGLGTRPVYCLSCYALGRETRDRNLYMPKLIFSHRSVDQTLMFGRLVGPN